MPAKPLDSTSAGNRTAKRPAPTVEDEVEPVRKKACGMQPAVTTIEVEPEPGLMFTTKSILKAKKNVISISTQTEPDTIDLTKTPNSPALRKEHTSSSTQTEPEIIAVPVVPALGPETVTIFRSPFNLSGLAKFASLMVRELSDWSGELTKVMIGLTPEEIRSREQNSRELHARFEKIKQWFDSHSLQQ
jgi:hypothetical protein